MNQPESKFYIPGLGELSPGCGLQVLEECSDGRFRPGRGGVRGVYGTGDGAVEFVAFEEHSLAYVKSKMGYPAYYPVPPVRLEKAVRAVLMDLDGTTVRSEEFWVWIIQQTVISLTGNRAFCFEDADLPHVSGHSVSEHLKYCIGKYCPGKTVEQARALYFEHTRREMAEILAGRGRKGAFTPAPGIRDFLLELKAMGVKIGLVTSGLYEKAYPEIVSAFDTLGMGDPRDFYDCIISAGFPLSKGSVGTLGELEPKPHPWLYAETARVGLGIDFADRSRVVGIEDSGAGVCSIRLAGFTTIGLANGNIKSSGSLGLCNHYCESFRQVMDILQ